LPILDYKWLMIHNGTCHTYQNLIPIEERLLVENNNDSARVFEFIRLRIIDYYLSNSNQSQIEGCRKAYVDLLEIDPIGGFNIILSNGYLNYVFIHFRPFYILNREKDSSDTINISTMKLTNDEEWLEIRPCSSKKARMLVFAGQTLIYNGISVALN
jgi:predicted glutamine amidotransferase